MTIPKPFEPSFNVGLLSSLTPTALEVLPKSLPRLLQQEALGEWSYWCREDQFEPVGDWRCWVFMGGRGAGKTRAGAEWVRPVHETARACRTWPEARRAIAELPLAPITCRVVSAHVMGGCAMADAPERGVTDHLGRHFQIDNLSIHDGSLFPTSIGANPQLSVYALVARNAAVLATALTGRPKPAIL